MSTIYGVTTGPAPGVEGESYAPDGVGVYGSAHGADAHGVEGVAPSGAGVRGESIDGAGVKGRSTNGSGVYGESANATGVAGHATGGTGVYGDSDTANGVTGQSNSGTGVFGGSTGGNGVVGASTSGSGVIGRADGPAARAATFLGTVVVDGDFQVTGAKSAAVPHPDGSQRLVYSLESPESWFEDYGSGQLVAGRAAVALDPDFAAIIDADTYHVFLTPYGETRGLFVGQRAPGGFTVQETGGGTSGVGFAYRIVARRGDIAPDRLAMIASPRPGPQ